MEKTHNFDEIVIRNGTDSKKYSESFYSKDTIPMWIADTDFKSPQPVISEIVERAQHGIYGYTITSERLKKAVKYWVSIRFGYNVPVDAIEYVPGVIAGIIYAIRSLTNEGDKVILQTPAYPQFVNAVENNGRRLLRNPLLLKNGKYEIDFDDFEKKCKDSRARLFILCNPQNPTGRVFTKQELNRLGQICIANNIYIISDEVHSDIIYGGRKHIPFYSISTEFAYNSITFLSASKTFNLPGLRTGAFIAENPNLKTLMHETIISNKAIGENIFGTLALCTSYERCSYYVEQLVEYLQGNLNQIKDLLLNIPNIDLIEPEGTYLFWLDCRKMRLNQEELMHKFINVAKVGVHDGMNFGLEGKGFVRINVGCPHIVLDKALHRIILALT